MLRFHLLNFLTGILFLVCIPVSGKGQLLSFQLVNAGTKSNIRQIETDKEGNVYFLTDDIYLLRNGCWKKLEFPVDGKIFTFLPVSPDEIWFTVNLVTNISTLYHYHDGITECIRSPLSNHISDICPAKENGLYFASYAEIVHYENKTFLKIPPAPVRHVIEKIVPIGKGEFRALTNTGELLHYKNENYYRLFRSLRVRDFCMTGPDQGYLVTNDALYRMVGNTLQVMNRNKLFGKVVRMIALEDGSLLMAGMDGLIARYSGTGLIRITTSCTENLSDVVKTNGGELWICGENGRLLYRGGTRFPEYRENQSGFSSDKLIYYGISTDDEYGTAIGDVNNDGQEDIYAVRIYEQNRLYINRISTERHYKVTSGFLEEAFRRNATGAIRPELGGVQNELKLGVCMADLENDGDQDLYLCYLNSGNRLLLNKGDGFFRNVSSQPHRACENMGRSNAAAVADVDLDGDLDLFVTNEEKSNRLFENDGTGHFRDITATAGIATDRGGMCASFTDVNGDGYPDLAVTFWNSINRIYLNAASGNRVYFRDITNLTDLGLAGSAKSNGVAFADVNNDGFSDLFIANRNAPNRLYLNDGRGVFKDRTRDYFPSGEFLTNGAVFADFDLDGYQDLYITCVGENVLYRNESGRFFSDVTASFGAELTGYCTGCAAGDIDQDGDPDLYVSNYINGDSKLFLNNTGHNRSIKFRLHGIRSNRDAIGAKVWLYEKGGKVPAGYRELTCGGGYASCSSKELIFGVEQGKEYFALIRFPSSADTLRLMQLHAGMALDVEECEGIDATVGRMKKNLVTFFSDEETRPEILKYLAILVVMVWYNLRFRSRIRRIRIIRLTSSLLILVVFVLLNSFFLYLWPVFYFFIAPLAFLVLLALLHLYIERTLIRKMAEKEKLELREKLSRDLHDDLASTLGSISIYADTLKAADENSPVEPKKLAGKISDLTRTSLQSISDIIWMTAPRNDSLQSLISKTTNYMLDVLTDNNIGFASDVELGETHIILSEKVRNDAFLILKEGLNNIIRHSGASQVSLYARVEKNRCVIRLQDDGCGFEETTRPARVSGGNGLPNLRRRAQESGIELVLATEINKGTLLQLKFEI